MQTRATTWTRPNTPSSRVCVDAHKRLCEIEGEGTPKRRDRWKPRSTPTPPTADQSMLAAQAEIRRINAKGDSKTLNEVKYLKTLHRRVEQLNAEQSARDDADIARAREKLRARKAQRPESIDVMTATRRELRDRSLEVIERDGGHLAPHQLDKIDKLVRETTEYVNPVTICRRLLLTESDAYRSAFRKALEPRGHPIFTPEEGAAVLAYRAANEGTGSAGGFGVPVLIDPTIIPSAGASAAPVLSLATSVVVTTDAWKGVTSPGTSWGWKGEAAAASDDSPTLAQPSIPVYTANGWIPFSYELGQDYPGWAAEAQMVLAQGYVDMMAEDTIAGSGSSQPFGVFNRLMGVTTSPSHIVVTTSGQLGAVDVRKAWSSLPQRWRDNATWLAHGSVETLVKQFASGNSEVDYHSALAPDGTRISALEGRPLVTTDYAPAFTGSTSGTYAYAVVGDFRGGFRVISRAGMEVQLVEQLFDQATALPTAQRGWYATARLGWDVIVNDAFRIIANA